MKAATFPALLSLFFLLCSATPALAQRDYTVVRPTNRASNEKVTATRRATQANKGILVVLLDPVIPGAVSVTEIKSGLVQTANANAKGIAEFELKRGQNYLVKAIFPGYLGTESKARLIKTSDSVRLQLKAQFARIELSGTPAGAEFFIDDQARTATNQDGRVVLDNLTAGNHTLRVRHREYNDYEAKLTGLEAGADYRFPLSTLLTKVAKLTIQSQPNATVMIDGDVRGRVNANGQVQIDYPLTQAAEHTITIEQLGYQPWTRKELLTPGPRTIQAQLKPIITSAGVTDDFSGLARWNAPTTWQIVREKNNQLDTSKLQVSGSAPGFLKEKTYRDFEASFTVWLTDGKGASWIVRADKTNYYLFHLSGPQAGELRPRKLYTYRIKDGVASEAELPTTLNLDFKDKDSYYVTVTVRGNEIKHNFASNATGLDSQATYTDTASDKDSFLYGSFGFVSFKGEVFQVDDLLIKPAND